MATYYCPEEIRIRFLGNEEEKSKARLDALEWAGTLSLQDGDIIHIPHPDTGELVEMCYDAKNRQH